MPKFEYNNLFNESGAHSTLDYLQSRLAARDLSAEEALAMLSVVHEELNNPANADRGVYQKYSEFMEALRTEMPEIHNYVVSAWEQRAQNNVKADKAEEREEDDLEGENPEFSDSDVEKKSGAELPEVGNALPEEEGGEEGDEPDEGEEKSEEASEKETDESTEEESDDVEDPDKESEKDEEKEDEGESEKEEKEEGREESETDESEREEEKDVDEEVSEGEETEEEEKESGEEGGDESEEGAEENESGEVAEVSEEGDAESGNAGEPELPETNDVETEPIEEEDEGDAATAD